MNTSVIILAVAFLAAAVMVLLFGYRSMRHERKRVLEAAQREAAQVVEDARRQSEAQMRETEVAAREKLLQARSEFEKVSRKQRSELEAQERRLTQKGDSLDKRTEDLTRRDKELSQLDRSLAGREKSAEKRETELDRMMAEERTKLEQIAGLTGQQAKEELVRVMEDEARMEAAHIVKRIEDEAREQASRQAQRIIGMAVQRAASDYVSETTVSVVMLPNDEMKGRIIGREGRNIRALEMATGVDLIVDDTPEAVILSGFDPFRREVARVALERLITDGRIHPARIEEVVEKVKAEFDQKIQQEGEAALLELAIPGMHPDLVK
ncbi:MAG TPA: Rnase Y domain-containing protein, partial [Thermoanaerobaculia bacterium]